MDEIYLSCQMHGCDVAFHPSQRIVYDALTGDVYHNYTHAEIEINHTRRQNELRVLTPEEISGRLLVVSQDEARRLIKQNLESKVEPQKPETD